MIQNFSQIKGDTLTRFSELIFKDSLWDPIDLTGSVLTFKVDLWWTSVFDETITITNAVWGLAWITIAKELMALDNTSYDYNLEWVDSSWIQITFLEWAMTIVKHPSALHRLILSISLWEFASAAPILWLYFSLASSPSLTFTIATLTPFFS